MKKSKKPKEIIKAQPKKTTFTLDEYDKLVLELDFIRGTLNLAFSLMQSVVDGDSEPMAFMNPVFYEALPKIEWIDELINNMRPIFIEKSEEATP